MNIIIIIYILLLPILKTFALSNECPPRYIKIGVESKWCMISNAVKEGYISYGSAGRWILTAFRNDGTSDLDVYCNSWFGEPWPYNSGGETHQTKFCCFQPTKTVFHSLGQPIGTPTFEKAENQEWAHPDFFGSTRFGYDEKYFYAVTKDVNVWCNRETFGANNKAHTNKCNLQSGPVAVRSIPEESWTLCGSASNSGTTEQFCTGLEAGGTYWIRFGYNGEYYYKLVTSTTQYPCYYGSYNGNSIEAKYFPHGNAQCWHSPRQFSFGIVGEWRPVTTCVGCQPLEYEVSIGIQQTTETERTEEWYTSLTLTMNGGVEFKGVSGSVELSATISQTVTNRVMHAITEENVKTVTVKCLENRRSLYQWIETVTEKDGLGSSSFQVDADFYRCQNKDPLCAPGFCSDDNCQDCTEGGAALSSSPVVDIETPHQIKNNPDVKINPIWIYGICAFVLLLVSVNVVMMIYSYSNCCGYVQQTKMIETYDEDLKSNP